MLATAPLTGDLIIDKDDPSLILDSAVDGANTLVGKEDGKARWTIHLGDDTTEVEDPDVANSGSDFRLNSHKDDGTDLAIPLKFTRATGLGTVLGDPTEDLGIATKKWSETTFIAKDPHLFAGIPVVAPGALDLTHAQKCVSGTGTVTIPANASIAFPVGTCLTFNAFGGTMTVAITTDTLYWNDGGVIKTGTRTISNTGIATALKVNATTWIFSGSGIT